MNAGFREMLLLEGSFRRDIDQDQLVLHCQLQVDLGSRKLIGVEALVRWRHPERGTVAPGDFIPMADASGLVFPMG